jgi:predicted phage-related endonuclease
MPLLRLDAPRLNRAHPLAGCDPMRLNEGAFVDWMLSCPDERGYARAMGGTDVGAIMGLSSHRSAAETWDKLLAQNTTIDNTNMRRGRLMEPVIAAEYTAETGRVLDHDETPVYGQIGAALFRASRDRGIVGVPEQSMTPIVVRGTIGVLEIKSMNQYMFRACKTNGLDPAYYAQVQHYMRLYGSPWGSVAVFNAEAWELHWFDVERNEPFIDEMHEGCARWWMNHVMTRQRPREVSETAVPAIQVPARIGASEARLDDPEWRRLATAAREAKAMQDMGKEAYERVRATIKERIEALGHTVVIAPGMRASYPERTTRKFEKERLIRSAPLDRMKVANVLLRELAYFNETVPQERIDETIRNVLAECGVSFAEYETMEATRTLTLTFQGS